LLGQYATQQETSQKKRGRSVIDFRAEGEGIYLYELPREKKKGSNFLPSYSLGKKRLPAKAARGNLSFFTQIKKGSRLLGEGKDYRIASKAHRKKRIGSCRPPWTQPYH